MPISYQWKKNGNVIDNNNNADFVFSQLASTEDSAVYSCQVMASSEYLTGTVDVWHSVFIIYCIRCRGTSTISGCQSKLISNVFL